MDELEKRRLQLADPYKHLQSIGDKSVEDLSVTERQSLKESQEFERTLHTAMSIDVPDSLADKVILNQRLRGRRNRYTYWAIAASFALVSVLGIYQINQPHLPLTQQALKHVYHEIDYLSKKELIPLDVVQARLDKMNLELPNLPERITFAEGCGLGGESAMHMIAEIDGKPVTLMITAALGLSNAKIFGDDRFIGKTRAIAAKNVIAIAEDSKLIDRVFQQISDEVIDIVSI